MNRLAYEKSPYLLQHADNPVDWYPWGDEAFSAARGGNKPIFLSIGYSTCHWCHVMAHESFEDQGIADALNRDFVAVKVDREERPDIDRVYMMFVQAITGTGGWPMSVWLAPDLKPFHGGTYFPPDSRWGRPGFLDVLREIARVWHSDRAGVEKAAEALINHVRSMSPAGSPGAVPGVDVLAEAVRQYRHAFDSRQGGFGGAPKFPRPSELLFLLSEHQRTGETTARDMAISTLDAIAMGGMRDHVGGGFHRYSVDAAWRVPHFEKMLYDQAQLALAYLAAAEVTGAERFAAVAEDTLRYVSRDMMDPRGGFYSAEDADSVPTERALDPDAHKTEGAFYLWGFDELGDLLGRNADLVRARFGIRRRGNAPVDPQQEFGLGNLLYEARTIEELSQEFGLGAEDVDARLDAARAAMLDARQRRPGPHLDDKILTAWNGLMIAAFSRAARVLRDPAYLTCAERGAMFVRDWMWRQDTHTLYRRYRDGDVAVEGFAEDYACAIWGALELTESGGGAEWLEWAQMLQRRQDELFLDEQGDGWFSTTGLDPSVVLRLKEQYDGAEPSAGSVSVGNLFALARLTGEDSWRLRAERSLGAATVILGGNSRAVPMMLANLSAYHRDRDDATKSGKRLE